MSSWRFLVELEIRHMAKENIMGMFTSETAVASRATMYAMYGFVHVKIILCVMIMEAWQAVV